MNRFTTTRLRLSLRPGLLIAALLAGAGGAWAQATINHNKALAGSVTPGDLPGYPVTISRPGHYKLTGNLTVPADTIAIDISADHVTLDLNGFTVAGPARCTRSAATRTVSCTGAAQLLRGIRVDNGAAGVRHTVVRNGRVIGFGIGVSMSIDSVVQDVAVMHNVAVGVSGAGRLQAERIVATLNGSTGIGAQAGLVRDSVASDNGSSGISGSASRLLLVSNSVASGNGHLGIDAATVRGTVQGGNGSINRTLVRSLGGNADDDGIY